jgi:tetratricopeptide (TPR) repeat protein
VALGLDQLRQNNQAGAMATFQRSVTDDASCTEGYVNLASLQRTSNNPAQVREALNNLRRALAIDAQYLPAFNEMALLYYDQAVRASGGLATVQGGVPAGSALSSDDDDSHHHQTARHLVKKGEIIRALRMFERATHLDDNMFEGWMNSARSR